MLKKIACLPVICLLTFTSLSAQDAAPGREHPLAVLAGRYETLYGRFIFNGGSGTWPQSPARISGMAEWQQGYKYASRTDSAAASFMAAALLPYTSGDPRAYSRKPVLRHFYATRANLLDVDAPGLQLYINPILYLKAGMDSDGFAYRNTRGAEVTGVLDNRLGFRAWITENQMTPTAGERAYRKAYGVYPGAHLVKGFGDNGIDFMQAGGYIDFRVLPSVKVQFGQGNHFIGHGMRSLLLSDHATPYLYLSFDTRVWKLAYRNIYARMIDKGGTRTQPLPVKYMAAHYLGIDITPRLNLGFFENVVFHDNRGAGRGFDPYYLNPVIFYRSVEHLLGDADKVLVGLNAAWLPVKGLRAYGQLMINEFRINDLRAGNGHAANKYGYQLGMIWVRAMGYTGLDLQAEYNRVRPYSYMHYTMDGASHPVNNYMHYNQHLAHPLGANFSEVLAKATLQPSPALSFEFTFMHAIYGADSLGSNWGQNVLLDYRTYEQELGNRPGQGVRTRVWLNTFSASWQIKHNLFLDADLQTRILRSAIRSRNSDWYYTGIGLRWNMGRKLGLM